jgi:hypothetical protein
MIYTGLKPAFRPALRGCMRLATTRAAKNFCRTGIAVKNASGFLEF